MTNNSTAVHYAHRSSAASGALVTMKMGLSFPGNASADVWLHGLDDACGDHGRKTPRGVSQRLQDVFFSGARQERYVVIVVHMHVPSAR